MQDLEKIEEALQDAPFGTVVKIRNYRDSSGETRDIEVSLMSPTEYTEMQQQELDVLRDTDLATLFGDGDLALTDMMAAREDLINSRMKSLESRANGGHGVSGYKFISESLCRIPDQPQALYLWRMKSTTEVASRPAKGAIPRCKRRLVTDLKLPSRFYIPVLKLEVGKFDDLTVHVTA